jgi:hypothetical protein
MAEFDRDRARLAAEIGSGDHRARRQGGSVMTKMLLAFCAIALAAGCGGAKGKAGGTGGIGTAVEGANLERIDSNKRCETGNNREVLVDLNQDGKADVRKIYAKSGDTEVVVCREADLNFDRTLDMFVYFDETGAIKRDEIDLDYDGVIDIISYYANGKVVKQELDTNSNGVVDRVRFLEDGVPTRVEGDTNGDGKVDYWEYYDAGKLIRVGMDTDGDGRADTWNRDEATPPEAGASVAPAAAGEGDDKAAGDDKKGADSGKDKGKTDSKAKGKDKDKDKKNEG